jgi:hypothetical protein
MTVDCLLQLLDKAVQENIFSTARAIVEGSTVVEDHLINGSLTIMVEVKGKLPPPEHHHHRHSHHRHHHFH